MSTSSATVEITFDKESGQFTPGEEITGKVIIFHQRPILGVSMNLIGKVKAVCVLENRELIAGRGHRRLSSHRYSDKYFIIKECKHLSRENENEEEPEEQEEGGVYTYKFSWELPENLPASFEGPYGWIRYHLGVVVRYSFWDHRCEAESVFHVLGAYDLNNLDRVYRQVLVENKWMNAGNQYGFTYLELNFEMERRAYVPGDKIRFGATVDFRNRGVHPPIKGVVVSVLQEQTYRIREKVKKNFVKIQQVVGPHLYPNVMEVWNGSLRLLPVPPSGLGGPCRIIDVQYYVKATLIYSETDKIDIIAKIQVGTIGFRSARERAPPLAQQDEFQVSIEYPPPPDPDEEVATLTSEAPLPSFLSIEPGPSARRASAPLWEPQSVVDVWNIATGVTNGPVPGPSNRPAVLRSETPPPSYLDAITVEQPNNDNPPPEYSIQPPFFLQASSRQRFQTNYGYSTL